ncbi:MAG: hypothetical protein CMO47_12680 [Verrucomicrobiales bacterium]|nr:hypothetical protein [Verrucomicrobiales bacterium]
MAHFASLPKKNDNLSGPVSILSDPIGHFFKLRPPGAPSDALPQNLLPKSRENNTRRSFRKSTEFHRNDPINVERKIVPLVKNSTAVP